MTAITVTEFSREELNTSVISGDEKRRAKYYLRATTATADETLDLATLDTNISDIEGLVYYTDDGAVAATAPTWSGTTLTSKTAGVQEYCIMCTLT